jgi:dihydropteroate synthase
MSSLVWQTSRFLIDLKRPRVMGIVNLTPDSFSDGGHNASLTKALAHAQSLLVQGADILDIGGESTRPGATPVSLADELSRVVPFLKEAVQWGVPISVDTYKPKVMQAALDLGADIINDIWALRQPGALQAIAQHANCGVCLMHMHREPSTMQASPMEGDAVPLVRQFLADQIKTVLATGIQPGRLMLDPGIGFGKNDAQNVSLLKRQNELRELGFPLLAGWSRKGSLARITAVGDLQPDVTHRLGASVAAALMAVQHGASVVRVHDVMETVQALKFWAEIDKSSA